MMGRDDEAWEGLLAVLKRVKPDGSIRILPDHHKETAVAMSSVVRQCELRNDDARLRELWPTLLRGLDHLIAMRDESYVLGGDYPAGDCSSRLLATEVSTARSRNTPRP